MSVVLEHRYRIELFLPVAGAVCVGTDESGERIIAEVLSVSPWFRGFVSLCARLPQPIGCRLMEAVLPYGVQVRIRRI